MNDEDFNIDDFIKKETEYLDIMDYAYNIAPRMCAKYPSFVEGDGQDAIANFYIDNNGEKITFAKLQRKNGLYYIVVRPNLDSTEGSWLPIESYELDRMLLTIEDSFDKLIAKRNMEQNE